MEKINVVEFIPCNRNTLQGFASVELAELGLVIPGFAIHKKGKNRWVELPAKPPTDPENYSKWTKVIKFYDIRKENEFKRMILESLDSLSDQIIEV